MERDKYEEAIEILEHERDIGNFELYDPPVWTMKERDEYYYRCELLNLAITALREKQQREKEKADVQ